MSLDQIVALQIEGKNLTLASMLRFANWTGSFGAIEQSIDNELIVAYAKEHGLEASSEELQEVVNDWRVRNELYQAAEAAEWLKERGLSTSDLGSFARIMVLEDRVRRHVVSGLVERYFAERRIDYDEVAISRIVVNERGLARELKFQAQEGAEFYLLARDHSLDESTRLAGGYAGRLTRTELPRAIAAQAFGAAPGTILGPIEIDKLYYVIRVEGIYPAELNAELRVRIERLLFADWIASRRKQANVHILLWGQEPPAPDTVNHGDH